MKQFNIPTFYRSNIIGAIKEARKITDPRKKDFSPSVLDFGPVRFFIARHFGFCYGVENAIEISYRALEENPGKKIYLLSQMIHNPDVNNDLQSRGIDFIMDTKGNQLISWDKINKGDIVLIPAFGTTLEILDLLKEKGIETKNYDTTCPFVTRVWKRAEQLGKQEYTIIIHGKHNHEETRATYSHSNQNSSSLIVKDLEEAKFLGEYILGKHSLEDFKTYFKGKYSEDFDPETSLNRIGVINQTTMLATETQEIANHLREINIEKFGMEHIKDHFADTRDTLCYATNENQDATYGLLEQDADMAIVVGGYNSSNTSHLVELCEEKFDTYYICNESELKSDTEIHHFNFRTKEMLVSKDYLPKKDIVNIILTSGASCPDAIVERVLQKILGYFENTRSIDAILEELERK